MVMRAAWKTCEMYGLRIRSDMDLPAPPQEGSFPEIEVRWGSPFPIPCKPPAGCVLAELSLAKDRGYVLTEVQGGYILRYFSLCEFRFNRRCDRIRVHLNPGADSRMVSILLGASVPSLILGLRGECMLHASAIELGGAALAFAGRSGMGKSTLAALFCSLGAGLITDDALRLISDGDGGFRCLWGAAEIRLRPCASALAELFPEKASSPTADDRIRIPLPTDGDSMFSLKGLILPRPSRTVSRLRVRRLTQAEALLSLVSSQRVTGWKGRQQLRSQFNWNGRLVKAVPVFEAQIPWGPPFSQGVCADLLRRIGFTEWVRKLSR